MSKRKNLVFYRPFSLVFKLSNHADETLLSPVAFMRLQPQLEPDTP